MLCHNPKDCNFDSHCLRASDITLLIMLTLLCFRKVEDSIQQAENSLLLHKFDRASSNESDQDGELLL